VIASRSQPGLFVPAAAMLVAGAALLILTLLGTTIVLGFAREGSPWAHYASVLGDPRTAGVLVNSVVFAVVGLVVSMAFGLPIAWLVECSDLPGRAGVLGAMLGSLLMPGFAQAMGWLFLLHPRIGILNQLAAQWLGIGPINIASLVGMGVVQGINMAPLAFLMTGAALRAIDGSYHEAAVTSGAGPGAIAWRVLLPLIRPALSSAAIYMLMIGFGAFDVPAIIGWSNRIFTFSTYIYLLTNPQDVLPEYGDAAALSTILLVVALALTGYSQWLTRHGWRYKVVTGKARAGRPVPLHRLRLLAWAFIGFYLLLGVGIPLLVLGWASLLPFMQPPSARAFALASFANYRGLPWQLVWLGARHTLLLAALVPPCVLVISFAFTWIGHRTKLRGRGLLDMVAFLPHAVPSIVFAVGVMLLALGGLGQILPVYGTVWILMIAFVAVWLSYGTRMTNAGFTQIHHDLEEAAAISGAPVGAIAWRIVLPLLLRGLLLAWIYLVILTVRELTLSVVLGTPGNMTLPLVIWSVWLNGGLGRASAVTICFLAGMLPLVLAYVWLLRRTQGGSLGAPGRTDEVTA